tara:strand:+ start:1002 stop:2690 length:1689 start_codon:yes stop_codon:yes gene_type:complete
MVKISIKKNKNNHTKKNKSRKMIKKNMTGGEVNTHMAYTYLAITAQYMKDHNATILNTWIHKHNQLCTCRSENKTESECAITQNNNLVIDDTQTILLVTKYDVIQKFTLKLININTDFEYIIMNTLGYCIIKEGTIKQQPIKCIYDVCMTDTSRTGYGKTLFAVIQSYLEFTYWETNPLIWLGIKMDSQIFDKVCKIYTSFGYSKPYNTSMDPFGKQLPFAVLSLQKPLNLYINMEGQTTMSLNNSKFLRDNYTAKRSNSNHVPSATIWFDNSCLYKLRLFPYVTTKGITEIDLNNPTHREYSGSFIVINNSYDSGIFNNLISFETKGINEQIEYIKGETEGVWVNTNSFTYHTHPLGVYINYKVCIGPPSGADVQTFLLGIMTKYDNNKKVYPNQAHFVIAVEGIYCLSLHKEFLKNEFSELCKEAKNAGLDTLNQWRIIKGGKHIGDEFEYPMQQRRYDWTSWDDLSLDDDYVEQNIAKYLKWVDTVNQNLVSNNIYKNPLLKIEFHSWKDLFSRESLGGYHIHFPSIYHNAFIPSRNLDPIPSIHGDKYYNLIKEGGYD